MLLDSAVVLKLDTSAVYHIQMLGDSIFIKSQTIISGRYKRIDFVAQNDAALLIRLVSPKGLPHIYFGSLSCSTFNHRMQLVNTLDIEKYVEGVIEMEAGQRQPLEYYKVQAIICRTYALSNMRKHESDNYNLCDNVHCQAYKGSNNLSKDILQACKLTANLVLVDINSELVTTAFHSNCGGQTCNSEDVWGKPKSYLKSVQDTFCLRQRNACWNKKISKSEWKDFLLQNSVQCSLDSSLIWVDFSQKERTSQLMVSSISLPLKSIRNDFKLKSTYFSIQSESDSLLFIGRGYGHGVGLCQEGAMRMAQLGIDCAGILHFYYQSIDIIDLNRLRFFKD